MDKKYILSEMSGLIGAERTARIDELAAYYNVSRQSIWRVLNDAGIRARSKRSDAGKTSIDERVLNSVAARVNISKRSGGKRFTCSVKKAMKEVQKEQEVDMPVSYSRVADIMRAKGMDKKSMLTPTPYCTLRSKYPNHVHLFDVTNCLQWHLKNGGGLTERDIERLLYKNKVVEEVKKIDRQLLRFVIVDHCTGAFFFWYYYTTGERAEHGADFFYRAWAEKQPLIEDVLGNKNYNGYQFCGTPEILFTDKGAILKKIEMLNLMASLDIKVMFHKAGNPRAKGKVEGLMRIIGDDFESDLRIYNIQSLDELNRFALKWCIERNRELGFRNNPAVSRIKLWNKITAEQIRLIADKDIYYRLIHSNKQSKLCNGAGIIRFSGRHYFCPDTNAAHKKIEVTMNAKEYPKINIHFNGMVYLSEPLDLDEFCRLNVPDSVEIGNYKAKHKTDAEYLSEKLEAVAKENYIGVDFKGHGYKRIATPPKGEKLPDTELQEDKKIVDIKRDGTVIDTPNPNKPLTEKIIDTEVEKIEIALESSVPIARLIKDYINEYGRLTAEENKLLRERFGEVIDSNVTTEDAHLFLIKASKISKLKIS